MESTPEADRTAQHITKRWIAHYDIAARLRHPERGAKPWWVLVDVCRADGIDNPSDVAGRLADDEKDAIDIIDPMGRPQRTTIVNRPGLTKVLRESRKSEERYFFTVVQTGHETVHFGWQASLNFLVPVRSPLNFVLQVGRQTIRAVRQVLKLPETSRNNGIVQYAIFSWVFETSVHGRRQKSGGEGVRRPI